MWGAGGVEGKRVESRCWSENQTQGVEWQLRAGQGGLVSERVKWSEQTVSTTVAFETLSDPTSHR